MIVEKDLQKLLTDLSRGEAAKIVLGGFPIDAISFENASKLRLSTAVYEGGNYIPKGVRECVGKHPPFERILSPTELTIDEEHFTIYLVYLGETSGIHQHQFVDLLEEFSALAHEWREYLDEHDRNDLIYVPVK